MWSCSIGGLADEELAGLAVVVGEPLRTHPLLGALRRLGERCEAAGRVLAWAAVVAGPRVRLVVDAPDRVVIAMWPSCWKWANGHFGALTAGG